MKSSWDKREVIGLLRLEIENIRRRGFGACFRDSVLCLNAGRSLPEEKCEGCVLLELVPPESRRLPRPCFHIPLDSSGQTLTTLSRTASREKCEQSVLAWVERTLEWLEAEVAAERRRKDRN